MDSELRDQFKRFFGSPTGHAFVSLRARIANSSQYDGWSDAISWAIELDKEGKPEEARQTLRSSMGSFLLSPQAHRVLAILNVKLANMKAAVMHSRVADACFEGMVCSGKGSKSEPYLVLHMSDVFDILGHLEKQYDLSRVDPKQFQGLGAVECSDGTQIWFDTKEMYENWLKRRGA